MPLNLPDKLPAIELLKEENIFVIDTSRATQQDIRPLRIVILNLMPLKITTETDLVRLLSNTSSSGRNLVYEDQESYIQEYADRAYANVLYRLRARCVDEKYDGMIITGAPVEQMDFEEVTYWEEITEIFDWARTHVHVYLIYMLGCASRTVSSLRNSQVSTGPENVRYLRTSGAGTFPFYLSWL